MESMDFKQFMVSLAGSAVEKPTSESEREEIEAEKKAADMEVDKVLEMLKRIRDEYNVANDKMEKTIEKFGTYDHLSGNGKVILSETVEMLQKSSVVDINRTNVFLQQARMALEESKLASSKRQFENCIQQVSTRCNNLEKRTEELKRDMQMAKDEFEEFKGSAEVKAVETKVYEHQVANCKKELVKLQAEGERLGLPDPKQFKEVLERVGEIAEMKVECSKLKAEMEQYDGLPPNLEQAEEMLAHTVHTHQHKNTLLRHTIENQSGRASSMMSDLSQQAARKFK